MGAPSPAADTRQSRLADGLFAVAMIAAAGATIFEARKQPRSPFDPVGAAAIPTWTAWIVIALAVVLLLRLALRRSTIGGAQSLFVGIVAQGEVDYRLRPMLALATLLLTVGYAALLPVAGFRTATVAYMLLLGWLMCDRRPASLAGTAVLAGAGGVAIDYIFRHVLYVPLP